MKLSSILGIICALTVFIAALVTSSPSMQVFLDPHGILIVIGGTAAARLICFPLRTFLTMGSVFFRKIIGSTPNAQQAIDELIGLAKGNRDDPKFLSAQVTKIKNPFLREAIELVVQWGFKDSVLDTILRKRAITQAKKYEEDAEVFMTISKFPPAFGLMGTTLGMIALLQKLGAPDSFKQLGPAMAIGLVATLYGIVLANFVFIPLGEHLLKLNKADEIIREIVIDGVKLLRAKEHPLVVDEHLKSYLLPSERRKSSLKAAA